MTKETITFNELRRIKDALPDGSITKMASLLDVSEETIRNYFGGENFDKGGTMGIHLEQGPAGGMVSFDDPVILNLARKIISGHI